MNQVIKKYGIIGYVNNIMKKGHDKLEQHAQESKIVKFINRINEKCNYKARS